MLLWPPISHGNRSGLTFFVIAQQLSLGQFQSLKEINKHLLILQVIVNSNKAK